MPSANDFIPIQLPPNFMNPGEASYGNVMKIFGTPTQNVSDFLPELQKLLQPDSSMIRPYIDAARETGASNIADLSGFFGKRGLTGSSIESAGIGEAVGKTNSGLAQMLSSMGISNSQHFANLFFQARSGDVQAMRQLQQMLAGGMGQELTAQRDMDMFKQQMQAGLSEADKARDAQFWSSLIGAGGQVGSAYMQYSDRRLKTDIEKVGARYGLPWYKFKFKTDKYPKLKLPKGVQHGVLADEAYDRYPDAVGVKNGFFTVNYGNLRKA